MKVRRAILLFVGVMLLQTITLPELSAQRKWYDLYEKGKNEMKRQNFAKALEYFLGAMKVQNVDKKKIRTYGVHFIKYFPHREAGIAYYHLGDMQSARRELQISLGQEYSARAQDYFGKTGDGISAPPPNRRKVKRITPPPPSREEVEDTVPVSPDRKVIDAVGERMGLAVLPFETKGLAGKVGNLDLLDKLITAFVNQGRFKVFERAQLEKVLEEQKLGMTGVIDASTAASIGKGIGVDVVVVGTITVGGRGLSVDARLIDTESAEIVTAKDAYASSVNIRSLTDMINQLAAKIKDDLPLINGYVIKVDGTQYVIDAGVGAGLKKGMKCIIFREGEDIRHPLTGEVLGKKITELGVVRLVETYDKYSVAVPTADQAQPIQIGDKMVTK